MTRSRVRTIAITRALLSLALSLSATPAFADEGAASFGPRRERIPDPPAVQITCPAPDPGAPVLAPVTMQVTWSGPDRGDVRGPFEYRYILLGPASEFPVALAISDPDAFRDFYANHPQGPWTGWSSTPARTPQALLTDLVPGVEHVFAVIALDRDGNDSPAFDLATNMLHFVAGYPVNTDPWAPVLTMSGPGFRHTYPQGGFCPCESTEVPTQMRGQRGTFRWSAVSGFECGGPRIRWYRWALDIEDVLDETPRIDEETDLAHWSQKSPDATSARLGPFAPGAVHRLYVQASDDLGIISLGIIRIEVPVAGERRALQLAAEAPRGGLARVSFVLPEAGDVEIAVYDLAGRRVATLADGARSAGTHDVTWNASGLEPGMYFYRLRAGSATVTRRVLLLD